MNGVNTDGRNLGMDTLGPLVNTVTLDTYDKPSQLGILGSTLLGTPFILGPTEQVADADGMTVVKAAGSTYGYITRGMRPAKINLSTMALADTGFVLDQKATDIISTVPAEQTSFSGTATAGTTTTLTLATASWGVDQWVGYTLTTLTGTGSGQALTILSNTATVLTFATATAPDSTTTFSITSSAAPVRSEVSVGQGDYSPYYVLQDTNIGVPPSTDTWAQNDAGAPAMKFGSAPDRTVVMAQRTLKGNIQTGTVTMTSPSLDVVATITEKDITFTGFAMDGNLWLVSTSDGPYMLDSQTGDFFPLISELDSDLQNGIHTQRWFPMGVIIPLHFGLRYQNFGQGASFGPEEFNMNASPVQGQPTGIAPTPRELFTIIHNDSTGDSYLVSWTPRRPGDQHGNPMSPYVIAKFTSTNSKFLRWLGTVDSVRTSPTLAGGYGSDCFYITCGRTSRWIDDSLYSYAASGTTYLTELRRQPGLIKDVEFVEIGLAGTMSATQTVTVGLSLDGGSTYQDFAASTAAGHTRLLASASGVPDTNFQGGRKIKPRIVYASDSATAVPQVEYFRIFYRIRPTMVRVMEYTFALLGTNANTMQELETKLRNMVYDAPVLLEDIDRKNVYVRLSKVAETNMDLVDATAEASHGLRRYVTVTMEEWTTA